MRESSVTNPENWSDEGYSDINMLRAMKIQSFLLLHHKWGYQVKNHWRDQRLLERENEVEKQWTQEKEECFREDRRELRKFPHSLSLQPTIVTVVEAWEELAHEQGIMSFGGLGCFYKEPFPVNTHLQTCVSFVSIWSSSVTKYNYGKSHLEWLDSK